LQSPDLVLPILQSAFESADTAFADSVLQFVLTMHSRAHPASRVLIEAIDGIFPALCDYLRASGPFTRARVSGISLAMSIIKHGYFPEEFSSELPVPVDYSRKKAIVPIDSVDLFHPPSPDRLLVRSSSASSFLTLRAVDRARPVEQRRQTAARIGDFLSTDDISASLSRDEFNFHPFPSMAPPIDLAAEIARGGCFPIEESPDETEETRTNPPPIDPSIDERLVISLVAEMMGQMFTHQRNSFFHNTIVDLFTVVLNFTECGRAVVRRAGMLGRLRAVAEMTEFVPFAGQLHQIVELIKEAEAFPDEERHQWEQYMNDVFRPSQELWDKDFGGELPDISVREPVALNPD
jgi:hypothetical protein